MRYAGMTLIVGAGVLVPLIALSKIGGGDITYKPKGADNVVFSHKHHVNLKGRKCTNCHYQPFQMLYDSCKMNMATLSRGNFCGTCHDGKKAFDVKAYENCTRCHKD